MLYAVISLAVLSILLIALVLVLHFKLKKQANLEKRDMTLLNDLSSSRGRALIEIKRISPADHFTWSPKDIL